MLDLEEQTAMSVTVRYATIEDLEQLVPLFDGYRQFYGQESDVLLAHDFLAERFRHQESVILVAESSRQMVGFTQLFPSFSSVRASRIFILNDLFVVPEARCQGVAQALLTMAAQAGRALGAVRLSLSTARTNEQAQKLYELQGWKRDETFLYYTLAL